MKKSVILALSTFLLLTLSLVIWSYVDDGATDSSSTDATSSNIDSSSLDISSSDSSNSGSSDNRTSSVSSSSVTSSAAVSSSSTPSSSATVSSSSAPSSSAAVSSANSEHSSSKPDLPVSLPLVLRINYANDDILSHYGEYYDFVENDASEYKVKIILTTNTPISDVRFCNGGIGEGDGSSVKFIPGQELYYLPQLTAEKPLVITTVFEGDTPTRGFTLTDGNGVKRVFSLAQSGMDGSVFLFDEGNG